MPPALLCDFPLRLGDWVQPRVGWGGLVVDLDGAGRLTLATRCDATGAVRERVICESDI